MTEVSHTVNWEAATPKPILREHEVHVWLSESGQESRGQNLLGVLSTEEVERAERFHFSPDRDRFVRGRGVLRMLLGRYLGVDPPRLRFRYNGYGKPALAGDWQGSGINFNMSNSGDIVLYAFALGHEVGVDVEHVHPGFAGEEVATSFFAPPEVEALRRTPPEARAAAFFSCWTRKEAYIKARGEGLSFPLDGFAVSVDTGAREVALEVFGDAQESRRWTIISLLPAQGYVAALAAEGGGWRLNCWRADI
jgi:4'-phosphopantetheinyl transferase